MLQADGLAPPQRYWAILVIMTGIAMTVLDGAIVNVALPTLAQTLHATAAESIWAINGYQIGTCILLLPLAALGEVLGYRRVYLAGMVVFTVASLFCTLAPNLPVLVAARFVQGMGSAGVMSTIGALVRYSVPQRLLGKTIGLNATVIGVSGAAAPSIASAILSVADWRWLFAVNLPLGVATIALGVWALPRVRGAERPWDYVSAILTAVGFGALIMGLDAFARGVSALLGAGLLALCAACGAALVRREWRATAPLVPVDLLKIPILGLSVAVATTFFCAQIIAFIALPFMLELSMGRSVVQTGLLMTAWPFSGAVAAPFAGYLSDKMAASVLGTFGLLCFAAGMVLLATAPVDVSDIQLVWRMALCGFGFGFYQAPNNRTILISAPHERSGAAGGLVSMSRLTGQSLGAVLTALLFRLMPIHAAGVMALSVAGALALAASGVSVLRSGKTLPNVRPASESA